LFFGSGMAFAEVVVPTIHQIHLLQFHREVHQQLYQIPPQLTITPGLVVNLIMDSLQSCISPKVNQDNTLLGLHLKV
jgi:hypothetical protein